MAKRLRKLRPLPVRSVSSLPKVKLTGITAVRWGEGQYQTISRAAALSGTPPAAWIRTYAYKLACAELRMQERRAAETRPGLRAG